ncbi:uncharacterized protein MONBRDRAFT_29521 [Monosiga brevicollis MX1]|uniref:HOOK N-terminal domain-containing protein n=1 Tax=Monosiga brevicollis TaxID=81824 RepID=A9VBB8_MONBE|nr:uncharacterized protein MONBRDRAFT_29521 [Monosiga brevicollis MX1]EDQ85209.1 predicted protein [Monosiga brevicollis MX1]|eukprot:XP_001750034.1 hypothetical protein [Monosiga brevicollis MX1]
MLVTKAAPPGFLPGTLPFSRCDGSYFGDYVDRVFDKVTDMEQRRHNLEVLLEAITNYYQDVLSHVILMELPLTDAIVNDPASELGKQGLSRFLLLMLGCAVKCANNERFVLQLRELDSDVQLQLMESINALFAGVLEVPMSNLEAQPTENLVELSRLTLEKLNLVLAERDDYARRLYRAEWTMLETSRCIDPKSDQEAAIQAIRHEADLKAHIRTLTDELDMKADAYDQLMVEYDARRNDINRLNTQVQELQATAEEAQTLRDDLDVFANKARDADRYKHELERLKQRVEDFEYVDKQRNDLLEQNRVLREQVTRAQESSLAAGNMKDDLDESDRKVQTLVIQVRDLNEAIAGHQLKNRQQYIDLARKDEQLAELKRELERLQERANEAQQRAERSLADAQDTVPLKTFLEAETEIVRLQTELESVKSFQKDAHTAHEELSTMRATLRSVEESLDEAQTELRNRIEQAAALQQRLDAADREKAELQRKADSNAEKMARSLNEESLRKATLETRLDAALSKSLELKDERIQVLEDRLQDANKQIEALRDISSRAPGLLIDTQDVETYKSHANRLRQTRRSSKPVISSPLSAQQERRDSDLDRDEAFHAATSVLRQELASLRDENQRLKSNHDRLADQLDDSLMRSDLNDSRAADLESSNADLVDKVERMRNRAKSAERDKAKLRKRLQVYAEKAAKMVRLHEQQLEENRNLASQLEDALMSNTELQFALRDLQRQLTQRQEASEAETGPGAPAAEPEEKKRRGTWFRRKKGQPKLKDKQGSQESLVMPQEPSTPVNQHIAQLAAPASVGSLGLNSSGGSETMGLYDILREGRMDMARRGYGKTPAHPPPQSRIHKESPVPLPGHANSREQTILEFFLSENRQPEWERRAHDRQQHPSNGAGNNASDEPARRPTSPTLQRQRRNLSGASRRGRTRQTCRMLSQAAHHVPSLLHHRDMNPDSSAEWDVAGTV